MLALSLVAQGVAAALAPSLGRRFGRVAFVVPMAAAVVVLALLAGPFVDALGGVPHRESYAWADGLGLSIDLRLDGFGALMALLIVGIQLLVAAYAYGYFTTPRPDLGRFTAN